MELYNLTIEEAQAGLKNKAFSSEDLTKSCIDRTNKVDSKVKAFLNTNFDNALTAAQEIDKKIASGQNLAPLAGIPVSVKDIMLTKGLKTTAASKMLQDYVAPYNATIINKIEDNINLGKVNLDAWAHGASTENSDFGPTHNPWDLERVPGGSSGGSAASVAASESIYSLGTDTGGSIRQPAAFCGVVGLKPTYGRVSRYGLIAMGSSLDCPGPITKTVKDAAIVLEQIAGWDKKDGTTLNKNVPSYSVELDNAKDLKGLRIGLVKEAFGQGLEDEVDGAVKAAAKKFEELGATVTEVSLPHLEYGIACYYIIMPAEVSSNLGRYDGIRYGLRTEEANNLIDQYMKSRSQGLGAEAKRRIMIGTYVLSAGYYDAYYKKAQQVRTLLINDINKTFEQVDVLLTPTAPTTAFKIGEKANDPLSMYLSDIYTVTANLAGIPGLSLPCGFDNNNLPIGMQLLAPQFEELRLLKTGHLYQKVTEWHKKHPKI